MDQTKERANGFVEAFTAELMRVRNETILECARIAGNGVYGCRASDRILELLNKKNTLAK